MSVKPPDYEAKIRKEWRENAADVPNQLNKRDEGLLKRIKTYKERFGYNIKKINDKIKNDEMFAAYFAKNPTGTTIHERIAHDWLKKALKTDIIKLPVSGKNAYYITNNGVIEKKREDERTPSKSLDFKWALNGVEFYAAHKYTKESGGAQDNQYNEMERLLRSFQSATNKNKVLIIIVDGAYYTEGKIENLSNFTRDRPPHSYVTHIEGVPDIMKKYAK